MAVMRVYSIKFYRYSEMSGKAIKKKKETESVSKFIGYLLPQQYAKFINIRTTYIKAERRNRR